MQDAKGVRVHLDNQGERAVDGDGIVPHVCQRVALDDGPKSCAHTVDSVPVAGQQRRLLTIAYLSRVWR